MGTSLYVQEMITTIITSAAGSTVPTSESRKSNHDMQRLEVEM